MKNTITTIVACGSFMSVQAQDYIGYRIGNSLTWDSTPNFTMTLAADQGISLVNGTHINCNRSLEQIVNNPQQTCIDPNISFGYYEDALSTIDLDYITAQPFWAAGSTLGSDVAAFQEFESLLNLNPGNADTTIFLYEAWGANWWMDQGYWDDLVSDSPMVLTTPAREYFDNLFIDLEQSLTREVKLIPVGEVLNNIFLTSSKPIGQGLADVTSGDFYRDDIHMSYDLGRFTAAATTACVLLDIPPFGMRHTWLNNFSDGGYSETVYIEIEQAIWDVVSSDFRTGVNPCLSDVNRDGLLNAQDFSAWIEAFNNGYSTADQNQDGYITGTDFTTWLNNYNNGC